jgi:hypothetical protein
MTARRTTFLLWAILIVCAPIPFFLIEVGRQPVAALLHQLGWLVALLVAEGGDSVVVPAVLLIGGQIVVAAALLGVVARGATFLLERVFGMAHERATLALAAILLLVATLVPVYSTPFRTAGLHATLLEAFQ